MNNSLEMKLAQLQDRYDELGALLSDAEVIAEQSLFRAYSPEYAEIEPVVLCYRLMRRIACEGSQTNFNP